jgi:hypothetical protein
MHLKKHSIWVRWKDVTCEDLVEFHGVRLNMAKHVKCSIKNFFSEQWLDSSWLYREIFSWKRFLQLYWGLHVSPPPRVGTADKHISPNVQSTKANKVGTSHICNC